MIAVKEVRVEEILSTLISSLSWCTCVYFLVLENQNASNQFTFVLSPEIFLFLRVFRLGHCTNSSFFDQYIIK